MSMKNNKFQRGVLPVPPMPFAPWGMPGKKDSAEEKKVDNTQKENIKTTVKNAWTQRNDRKKSAADNRMQQWKQFFDYMMKLQDTFAASLPDDISSLPPYMQMIPVTPKAFMEQLKEFEIMANEHFVEQVDSVTDFISKGREQFFDMVSAAMDKKEEDEPAQTDSKDSAKEKAEAEEKTEAKTQRTTRAKAGTKTGTKAGTKTETKAGTKPGRKPRTKTAEVAAAKVEEKAEVKSEVKAEEKATKKTRAKAGKKGGSKAGSKATKKAKAEEAVQETVEASVVETVEDNAVKEEVIETVTETVESEA